MPIRLNPNYECKYIYKEPESKPLESLANFKIDFDLDLSAENLEYKRIYTTQYIAFLCKKYKIISENIVYFLKHKLKETQKLAYNAFSTNKDAIFLVNDLDENVEDITEFMCFSHAMVREFFNCVYILKINKIDNYKLVLQASEFMPFRRVFLYTENYDLLINVFKDWSRRTYCPTMLEPFVYICSKKSNIESNIIKDYVSISKNIKDLNIDTQIIKNNLLKLNKKFRNYVPDNKVYYSPALYLSNAFL